MIELDNPADGIRAARRLVLYRLAADAALADYPPGMTVSVLVAARDGSPAGDPSHEWTDDDLEVIVRRVYAEHRRRTVLGDLGVAS